MKPESVELFMTEGKHNKTYRVWLGPSKSTVGWSVTFAYGCIGSTLTYGSKVEGTSYFAAKQVYDKLVASKIAKGYRTESYKEFYEKAPVPLVKQKAAPKPKPEPILTPVQEEPRGRKFRDAY